MRLDSGAVWIEDLDVEARIASLAASTESAAKALDKLRFRVDEGFREMQADISESRHEFDRRLNEVRIELRINLTDARNEADERRKLRSSVRWLIGLQVATLTGVLLLLVRAVDLF